MKIVRMVLKTNFSNGSSIYRPVVTSYWNLSNFSLSRIVIALLILCQTLLMIFGINVEQITIALGLCFGLYVTVSKRAVQRSLTNAVVIGASSGIGREIALQLNCDKVIVARRKLELDKVASCCNNTFVYPGDITKPEDMAGLLEFAVEKLGRVDTLIICSGVLSVLPFEELSAEIIPKILAINAVAPIMTTKIFLPELIRNCGQIIVISSASGTLPAPTRTLYTASKHALTGFFRSLRIEIGNKIHICHVMPGSVDTNLRAAALDKSVSCRSQGAMSARDCATKILKAAARLEDEVYIPAYYKLATAISVYFPNFINNIAKRKYNYPSS